MKYRRVLLKISGETLKGAHEHGYDAAAVRKVVDTVKQARDNNIQIALVVGAGNIWRGVMGAAGGMDPVTADYMGMLGTVMNALCLSDFFRSANVPCEVFSAVAMEPIAKKFNRGDAVKALNEGKVVIFGGGTGCPFFTTDTTAALRALEMNCEALLKATKVDGIYTADPFKYPDAKRFSTLTYDEALSRKLAVMDAAAFSMCRDRGLPIIVLNFFEDGALMRVLDGDFSAGTLVAAAGM